MRLTLADELAALREGLAESCVRQPKRSDDLAQAAAVGVWQIPSGPSDDRALAAVMVAEAIGRIAADTDIGTHLMIAWLETRYPHLGPLFAATQHATPAAAAPEGPAPQAATSGSCYRLTGSCRFLQSQLASAGSALVPARMGTEELLASVPLDGSELRMVSHRTAERNWDLCEVVLDKAQVAGERVALLTPDTCTLEEVLAVGRTVSAAEQLGAAQWAFDAAVERIRERHQFGRPVASFQAIAHRCADMFADLELARSMVYAAAASQRPSGAPGAREAALAKVLLHRIGMDVITTAVHLFGADGLRENGGLHRRFSRCQMLRNLWGEQGDAARAATEGLADMYSARESDAGI